MEEHYRRGQPCAGSSGSSICLPALQHRQSPAAVEREHMFDKVVTPSDVGKLNRLVIPKQYAERYFPMDSSGAGEKGLLLSFEDRTGKSWRFRYSYWSSSQSYVMTKGWSRFVKEKRLGAGDTVSFGRGAGEADRGRLFIDWTHRQDASGAFRLTGFTPPNHIYCNQYCFGSSSATPFAAHPAVAPFLFWPPASVPPPAVSELDQCRQVDYGPRTATAGSSRTCLFFRSAPAPTGMDGRNEQGAAVVHNEVSVVSGRTAAKQVRLFGVNLGCPEREADPEERDD